MCVISFVGSHYQDLWPWPGPQITPTVPMPNWPTTPVEGNGTNWTITTMEAQKEKTALEAFEKLLEAARELDKILGLPDCEDPNKTSWIEQVRARVREHELAKIDQRLGK